ncbi:sensor histidine kinase [Alysiella crassa]|nr:HAMP domain-containing sensor histidine kinase [Alysiella crassa]UOP06590.1 HAMP domain-containing histidine kinase [Alysiella crassa]
MKSKLTSIQAQLNRAFILISLPFAVLAAAVSFAQTYYETNEFQDNLLKQAAQYTTPHTPITHDDDPDDDDEDEATIYTEFSSSSLQNNLNLQELSVGYHTIQKNGDSYRVYVRQTERGRVAVWQNNEQRNQLAIQSALFSSLPLLLLIPLFSWVIWRTVRRTLAPIATLSGSLKMRHETDLTPLPTDNIPKEIQGFVQSINDMLARTERVMQQQQRFIADAAHELRTPMAALSMQAERLQGQNLPTNLAVQLSDLQNIIQRNRHLLEQLLQHARAQAIESKRVIQIIDIKTIFLSVIETLLPLAEAKAQDLGVASEANPRVAMNEMDAFILLKTLVDNAIRYTPQGSQIDLSAYETTQHIVLQVEDNGGGIAAAERERVLQPFYRVLGTDEQGSGLGLAIADTIARRYGGWIELGESETFGQGLRVRIYLPK